MRVGALALSCVVAASLASEVGSGTPRPQLALRASPRIGFLPSPVVLTGELVGGDDVEDFHCPLVEWDWDDGSRSTRESDCEPGGTDAGMERRFTARHVYREAGNFRPRLTLSRGGHSLAAATVLVDVREPFESEQ